MSLQQEIKVKIQSLLYSKQTTHEHTGPRGWLRAMRAVSSHVVVNGERSGVRSSADTIPEQLHQCRNALPSTSRPGISPKSAVDNVGVQ
eukprot:429458-Pleurochrysis_carterae.AAC.2